ncbi:hypothetical protein AMC82_PC00021 (plasmid) [Rhizobium phaseoli]|uniref:hypothetical protein n=1 Tax=Rhizobium phaseoli TaxID=396 RepID=UPI0007EA5753|nr:hypothetical protein [Rhizobium phaseoli]ANL68585.1 hypothetical protein AMC84_PC00021 [Rhizobium phaseoli]ANL81394.1 hypothetical protein AMC82_PC00021 [Rhizobium phaseoli]
MNYFGDKKWLVFVLPGFFALFVASFISDFPQIRDAQLPIVYVALTVLSVAVPFLAAHLYGRWKGQTYTLDSLLTSPSMISSIFLCSLILGFLFGVAHTTDYVSRGLRSLFGKDIILTASQSDALHYLLKNSYNENFLDGNPYIKSISNRYARIYSGDKRNVYEGVVASFFESTESPQAYLSPACLISNDRAFPINGPGVWLNLDKVADIQFIDARCSICAEQVALAAGQTKNWQCPFEDLKQAMP